MLTKFSSTSFRSAILKISLGMMVVVIGVGLGLSIWLYSKDPNPKNWLTKLQDPAKVEQAEVKNLIEEIGKITVLPQEETPSVATVVDKTTLESQPFFAQAQNGDKVLIYSQAQRAYLYRPSTHQIVNIGPLIIDQK